MGELYRAHDTRLNREVAIKVLPESVSSDPERLRRFEQEARTAAALNHPNILAVYQMATHEGVSYMVTELLEGETLRERIRRGAIPLRNAIDYGVQIARGLAAAHEKGIVPRDLKSQSKSCRPSINDRCETPIMHASVTAFWECQTDGESVNGDPVQISLYCMAGEGIERGARAIL
jgi:serine/threonine protein kinase